MLFRHGTHGKIEIRTELIVTAGQDLERFLANSAIFDLLASV